jgi:predicted NBD/HSP70 family sugar kinase
VGALYASIDLGGTKIACALARNGEDILAEERVPTNSHEGLR